ncbi:hypothetical protein A2U01_0069444, partial [Trifolium medium]|nr:hypothetical protein [Trifolium medium]
MASGNCHRGAMISSWHDTAVSLLNKYADLLQFYPSPLCCDGCHRVAMGLLDFFIFCSFLCKFFYSCFLA